MSFQFEVWPTEADRVITQPFGVNRSYYSQFDLPGHDGIDLRAPNGSRIFCVADGTVIRVHENAYDHNYGLHVYVKHADGYITGYAHLAEIHVKLNQPVSAGTVVGLADSTGNSFASHLHLTLKREGYTYEGWPYNLADPTPFLLPLLGWRRPVGETILGYVHEAGLYIQGDLAQIVPDGANLWIEPGEEAYFVPGGTIVINRNQAADRYRLVEVTKVSIGQSESAEMPAQELILPEPTVSTVDGWALEYHLEPDGLYATVDVQAVHVRSGPGRAEKNLGLVGSNSRVRLLGRRENAHLLIRARRQDFITSISIPIPDLDGGSANGNGDSANGSTPRQPIDRNRTFLGWVDADHVKLDGARAGVVIRRFGTDLRRTSDPESDVFGIIKGFAVIRIGGRARDGSLPVIVSGSDLIMIYEEVPAVAEPEPLAPADPPPPVITPSDTVPGWLFTPNLRATQNSEAVVTGPGGILRANPRRDAEALGYVPPDSVVIVTDGPQGEYTPVRVAEAILQPTRESDPAEPVVSGPARFGLHASADPAITDAEVALFAQARPSLIKLMSSHDPNGISKLVQQHPNASYVVRAFLEFGNRPVTPGQFVEWTLSDTRRTLNLLRGRPVVVELHNEPNVRPEGWGTAWSNGRAFATWWLDVLQRYRQALPDVKFIYPGLSPGGSNVIRQDHVEFIEASRSAVNAADGLAIHTYWSHVYSMELALRVVDDYITRFRGVPIWITEAGNGSSVVSSTRKGDEYVSFWSQLTSRPSVQGVTYFVASASNPEFEWWEWLGTDIGRIVGQR